MTEFIFYICSVYFSTKILEMQLGSKMWSIPKRKAVKETIGPDLNLADFKAAILNMFKELKESMFRELKENMVWMNKYRDNLSGAMETLLKTKKAG